MTTSREYLLNLPGPEIREPIDALRLLIECDRESAELLIAWHFEERRPSADSLAAYFRRRAYVLVRAAEQWPEFETAADAAVTWQRAEAAAVQEAVSLAKGPAAGGADGQAGHDAP
jgi:hypothetical protein